METVEDFLEHHGVKGQKWGVRRRSAREEKARAKQFAKPKAKDLSDDELKSAINRMELEKRYTTLSGGNKPSPGKNVAKFIGGIGGTAVKTAGTALATQQVASALSKASAKAATKKAAAKAAT